MNHTRSETLSILINSGHKLTSPINSHHKLTSPIKSVSHPLSSQVGINLQHTAICNPSTLHSVYQSAEIKMPHTSPHTPTTHLSPPPRALITPTNSSTPLSHTSAVTVSRNPGLSSPQDVTQGTFSKMSLGYCGTVDYASRAPDGRVVAEEVVTVDAQGLLVANAGLDRTLLECRFGRGDRHKGCHLREAWRR